MMALPILPGTTATNYDGFAADAAADDEALSSEAQLDDAGASPALNGFAALLAAVLPPPVNQAAEPSNAADGAGTGASVEEIGANPRPAGKAAGDLLSSWNAAPLAPLGADAKAQTDAEARLLNEVKSLVRQATAEMGAQTGKPRDARADAPSSGTSLRLVAPLSSSVAETEEARKPEACATSNALAAAPPLETAPRANAAGVPTVAPQAVETASSSTVSVGQLGPSPQAVTPMTDAALSAPPQGRDTMPIARAEFAPASTESGATGDDGQALPAELFNVRLDAAAAPVSRAVTTEALSLLAFQPPARDKREMKGVTFTALRLDDVAPQEVAPEVAPEAAQADAPRAAEQSSALRPEAVRSEGTTAQAEAAPVPEDMKLMTPPAPALRAPVPERLQRVTAELLRLTNAPAPRAMPSAIDGSSSPQSLQPGPQPLQSGGESRMNATADVVNPLLVNADTLVSAMPADDAPQNAPRAAIDAVAVPQGTEFAPTPSASNFDKNAAADAPVVDATAQPVAATAQPAAASPADAPRVPLLERGQRITNISALGEAPKRTAASREAKGSSAGASSASSHHRAEAQGGAPVKFTTAGEAADGESSERQAGGEGRREGQSLAAKDGAKEAASFSPAEGVGDTTTSPVAALHATAAPHEVRAAGPHRAESVVTQTATQLTHAAETTARHETRTLRFDLRPEHLGRVEVELTRNGEGHVRAHLTAERGDAGQSLTDGIGQLRESLERAGVTVDRLDVSVRTDLSAAGGHGRQSQQQEQASSAPASYAYPGLEQPEADDAPRAVEDDRLISLRA